MGRGWLEAEKGGASRAGRVARWFGVKAEQLTRPAFAGGKLPWPGAGQVVLISGPSGAGKSSLLRQYRRAFGAERWVDLERVRLGRGPVIELFPELELEEALGLLARFGLAEAQTYLLPAAKLSAGQRWRLRLAKAAGMLGGGQLRCLGCDEFGALLDGVTAAVVARALGRLIACAPGACAVLASSREDLLVPLCPHRHIRCDFGGWEVEDGR